MKSLEFCSSEILKLPVEEIRVPKNVYLCSISMFLYRYETLGLSFLLSFLKDHNFGLFGIYI